MAKGLQPKMCQEIYTTCLTESGQDTAIPLSWIHASLSLRSMQSHMPASSHARKVWGMHLIPCLENQKHFQHNWSYCVHEERTCPSTLCCLIAFLLHYLYLLWVICISKEISISPSTLMKPQLANSMMYA